MPARRTFGERPRPRILAWDVQPVVTAALQESFPTVRAIEQLVEVDQSEYDVVVTETWNTRCADHLWVIAAGSATFGPYHPPSGISRDGERLGVVFGDETRSRELAIPAELGAAFTDLAERDLVPLLSARDTNPVLSLGWYPGITDNRRAVRDVVRPLVESTRGDVLAGSFVRSEAGNQCVCLPEGAHLVRWVEAAADLWHEIDPGVFPKTSYAGWRSQARWQTKHERDAAQVLSDTLAARTAAVAEHDALVTAAENALQQAQADTDEGLRRLLTAQGDDLVETVAGALATLGFDVTNMDSIWDEGDRLEDLHVRSSSDRGIALCEVRGYARGAALSDYARIYTRFLPRFIAREGSAPSAAWLIVNHSLATDPSARDTPLASHPEDVRIYGEADVPALLIDTRHLFEITRDVELGVMSQTDAQDHLRESRGRFEYPRSDRTTDGASV